MKLRVEDIQEAPRVLELRENTGVANETLSATDPAPFRFEEPATGRIRYYRHGDDLFFEGSVRAALTGSCARCLERFPLSIEREFRFVLKPASGRKADEDEDGALGFYSGEEIDLGPRLREEMILGLPTQALCAEDCPGLCDHCGRNRREGSCSCEDEWQDPRLAPLRNLKVRH